jgi:hypothetical protein
MLPLHRHSGPDPQTRFPIPGNQKLQFIKPSITRKNIIAGEYSYYDSKHGESFEDQVLYHYEAIGELEIRWWDWDVEEIHQNLEFIIKGEIERLKRHRRS